MQTAKRLALAGVFSAVGVVASTFYIPVGAAKCFPVQSMINVLTGILLGPAYAVGSAFVTSTIRIILGTGSPLAYPGSMIGALLVGLLYKRFKSLTLAYLGEIVGTGLLGALAAWPIVTLLLSKEAALFAYVIPFSLSAVGGATISILLTRLLLRMKVWNRLMGAK